MKYPLQKVNGSRKKEIKKRPKIPCINYKKLKNIEQMEIHNPKYEKIKHPESLNYSWHTK